MSMALSGSETWRYWLRRDRVKDDKGKDLPAEKQDSARPHFVMKHLTGREQRALAEALDALEAHPKGGATAAYVDLAFAAAKVAGVASWYTGRGGVPAWYAGSGDSIEDIAGLGYREAIELAYAAFAGGVTAGDLGNLDSPSNTAGAESASPANAPAA